MTYNVVKDFKLGEKEYHVGEPINITEEQLASLPEETSAAFKEAIERGDVVDASNVVEPATSAPVVPEVQGAAEEPVNADEGKATAAAGGAEPEAAPVSATSAESTASTTPTETESASPSPKQPAKSWVGGHTIGQENNRKGGSLTTRDPNLAKK